MKIERNSKVVRVNNKCDSLRTTIPTPIKDLLGLSCGDTITWKCSCGKKGIIEVSASNRNEGGGV